MHGGCKVECVNLRGGRGEGMRLLTEKPPISPWCTRRGAHDAAGAGGAGRRLRGAAHVGEWCCPGMGVVCDVGHPRGSER